MTHLRPFSVTCLLLFCLLFPDWQSAANELLQLNNDAVKLLKTGRYLEGLELLKEAYARSFEQEQVRRNLVAAYLVGGKFLNQQQRYRELAELMAEAQQVDDTQRDFWSLRGLALLELGEPDAAEVELQEARVMGEPDAGILLLLGKAYYQRDRLLEAADVLESAMLYASDSAGIAQLLEKVRRELAVEEEMQREYGGHFVISFDDQKNHELGSQVLEVLEEAYLALGSLLDYYPRQRVTVLLYTRQQFSELTDSPEWAAGLYDGKIRLPVGGIKQVNRTVRALLYHEYMHVILREIAGRKLPAWLNEGLAITAEVASGLTRLEKDGFDRAGELFSLRQLEQPFGRYDGHQSFLAYRQSYSLVNFLIDEYGEHHLRSLLFGLAEGGDIADVFAESYSLYGLSYPDFENRWRKRQSTE